MEEAVDLAEVSASARGSGAVWTLRGSGDLNANLVRFPLGEGVGEHVNGEVDVLFVGVSGSGVVEVDGREHDLGPSRSTVSMLSGFSASKATAALASISPSP